MNVRRLGVLVTLVGLFLAGLSTGFADPPVLPRGKGDMCVEPTDVMRRDHMNFLLHQRDKTVHLGIRTEQHSLTGCVDCHAQSNNAGQYIPVNAPDQFCEACHSYASVKLDCFECHATTPDSDESTAHNFSKVSDGVTKISPPRSVQHHNIVKVLP